MEQVRERQEEIVTQFPVQPKPGGLFTDTAKRAVTGVLRGVNTRASRRGRTPLPPPSSEVKRFMLRALNNPNFLAMIERLAQE
jgi:hypothetical protein